MSCDRNDIYCEKTYLLLKKKDFSGKDGTNGSIVIQHSKKKSLSRRVLMDVLELLIEPDLFF